VTPNNDATLFRPREGKVVEADVLRLWKDVAGDTSPEPWDEDSV
jgi:hypothetical protein